MLTSSKLRKEFIDFFTKKHHKNVPGQSLVPAGDSTLLFTNAGMVPFKDVFLGVETRSYDKAVSVQRCVRAGGKHNDLENVGYTARHHTFFEMLGNFSFGAYFKREAITYAWEFLTEVLKISPDKLWVTVYMDDKTSADIWLNEIKIDPSRFTKIATNDNFWSMGDTGPCGPCSEIFYDHGPDIAGGPPGSENEDGDRFVEIWNLVFMEYNRDAMSKLNPLPRPCVDTGMGIERLAAVVQGVHDNYDTDLFVPLIKKMAKIANIQELHSRSLRVIADHIRACVFLIADGVTPSNEGRGYVLRRIIRRAVRHGHKLGASGIFFYKLVSTLIDIMDKAYPKLVKEQKRIEEILKKEEEQFLRTLDKGLKILEQDIAKLDGSQILGETIFKLYDTYGFPIDLTADIAREKDLSLDMAGYAKAMQEQQDRARAANKFNIDYTKTMNLKQSSEFVGYEELVVKTKIEAILADGQSVKQLQAGDTGVVILEATPFYPEAGGQVGDCGVIKNDDGEFVVKTTKKQAEAILHFGKVTKGTIKVDKKFIAEVDETARLRTSANHTVTHILHSALREVLGEHVQQKGSAVDIKGLRFDFSHGESISNEQLYEVEQIVNEKICSNVSVKISEASMEKAKEMGAIALFGEKYGEHVRVVKIDHFSMELCGGTHVKRVGDIGLFKIKSEGSIASGVRRIEAISGNEALKFTQNIQEDAVRAGSLLKATPDMLYDKIEQLLAKQKQLEKDISQLSDKLSANMSNDLLNNVQQVSGVNVLSIKLADNFDPKGMRKLMDELKSKITNAVIVLGLVNSGRVSVIAGVTNDLTDRFHAGKIVSFVANIVGGKGGGRADMAQAGGSQPENLAKALESVPGWVVENVGNRS